MNPFEMNQPLYFAKMMPDGTFGVPIKAEIRSVSLKEVFKKPKKVKKTKKGGKWQYYKRKSLKSKEIKFCEYLQRLIQRKYAENMKYAKQICTEAIFDEKKRGNENDT